MSHSIRLLCHSMLAQMALISFLFLGGFIYFIFAQPAMESYNRWQEHIETNKSSLPNTVESLISNINNYYFVEVGQNNAEPNALSRQAFMQSVQDANPDFQFKIQFNQQVYTNAPSDQPLTDYQEVYTVLRSKDKYKTRDNKNICNSIYHSDGNPNQPLRQYFFARQCVDLDLTLEFTGLTSPITLDPPPRESPLTRWVWNSSQETIFAALGIFVIMSVVLVFNLRFIRRLTAVAKRFDLNADTNKPLPEKGLPVEVLPLVHAVNQMVEKVKKTKEKHDFFLSAAAHEMRTPLTILRTRLAVLEDSPIKTLLEADIRRIIDMVNQLLMLMRVSTPQQLGKPLYLSLLCQKVAGNIKPLFQERGVDLTINITPSSEKILGDWQLLEIAVLNLLENALSFSEAGGQVTITLDRKQRISIEDQGPGIKPDQLDNIFTPFSKFPPNRRGHHGLGLAIVNAIVSLHHGTVSARNHNNGAEFSMDFG